MLALTLGEPAGIGPDLAVLWAQQDRDLDLLVVGDPDLLRERARLRGLSLTLRTEPDRPTRIAGELTLLEVAAGVPVEVPVIFSMVKIVNTSRAWYERSPAVQRNGRVLT